MIRAIRYGHETMQFDDKGRVSRPAIKMPASGNWLITGAVQRNNFGAVVDRYSLDDLLIYGGNLPWQWKNGKQRIFITDLDHGTRREWRTDHRVLWEVK